MEDHLILSVDQLVAPQEVEVPGFIGKASCSHGAGLSNVTDTQKDGKFDASGEEEPLIQSVECRICQEEDSIKNLEVPCACSGSLKFAHRKCVQRWCNEKRDIICEICRQAYKPGYTAPPPESEEAVIDISGTWTHAGTPLDLNDPRVLAMAAAEHRLLDRDYDYEDNSASGALFCRSAAIILMSLLLLRHALTIGDGDSDDDDPSAFFALFLLRAAGFLLPCYIMIWAISILQRRRQAQEAETAAAADVAFMIQAGQHRGLQVMIAPGPAMARTPAAIPVPAVVPTHEPLQYGTWTHAGTPLDLNDPRVLAMAAAEHRLLDRDYDYEDNSASGALFCRSAAIILMSLLLLRHALTIGDGDSDDDDPSAFFALFLLRAAGFLLPCYIMIWAISILQRRRQAQEAETAAAADVAFMIQAGQHRGLQVMIAPGPAMARTPAAIPVPAVVPTHEPLQ